MHSSLLYLVTMTLNSFIDLTTIDRQQTNNNVMTNGSESNHGRRCRCKEPRQVLREIVIDDADHSDESNGKKDSIEALNAESAQSSEIEEEKPESVASISSIGKSEVENETSLNLRLSSDAEDETGVNSDVNEARQDSKDTGNAYF